ncbi:MAG: hypothetical protein MdMp014T_1787 [Treponematales bacterium]
MKNGMGKKAALALGGCQDAWGGDGGGGTDGGGNEPDAEVQNLINLDDPQASAGAGWTYDGAGVFFIAGDIRRGRRKPHPRPLRQQHSQRFRMVARYLHKQQRKRDHQRLRQTDRRGRLRRGGHRQFLGQQ